jgi:hypothetical protein
MRNHGVRLFAIVSMLALLFGGQLCMLVDCGAKPAGATGATAKADHSCCANGSPPAPRRRPAPHDCAKPCCMSAATSPVPELARPDFFGARELAVAIAAYDVSLPAVTERPFESRAPRLRHVSPPRLAAGLRAPPC